MAGNNEGGEPNKTEPQPEQNVSYDTHRRLLGEKKNMQASLEAANARLAELSAANEAAEDARLTEQNEFKTLYEKSKASNEAFQAQIAQRDAMETRRKKEDLLNSKLNVSKREYLQFADVDSIDLNDPDSVSAVAAKFTAEHSGLINKPASELPKSNAPVDYGETRSADPQGQSFKNISVDDMHEVFENPEKYENFK